MIFFICVDFLMQDKIKSDPKKVTINYIAYFFIAQLRN